MEHIGRHMNMDEVEVYTVDNVKVVKEEFFKKPKDVRPTGKPVLIVVEGAYVLQGYLFINPNNADTTTSVSFWGPVKSLDVNSNRSRPYKTTLPGIQ